MCSDGAIGARGSDDMLSSADARWTAERSESVTEDRCSVRQMHAAATLPVSASFRLLVEQDTG